MMDHAYHNTLENATVVQLTAVLSADSQYSEEHVLKCTFKACDPEETGQVSVFRIIEYLQEMTGQSCEDWRLQSLYKRLDPEEQGLTVDFFTFYTIMKDWIVDCQQEGNQQTLEQAKISANELEDLKIFSKSMEEENNRLHTQARQLEKEQQLLSVKMDNLQDENRKLLLEKESSEGKIKELFTKKAKMKSQLSEYENRISCKDAALNKKIKQIEVLTITLDEYRMMVQQEISKECGLPSPLCGMLNSLVIHSVAEGSIDCLTEQEHNKKGLDDIKALLPVSHSLSQLSLLTDDNDQLILKIQEHTQNQNNLLSEKGGSREESKQILTNEHIGNSKTLELTLKNMDLWAYPSNIESQVDLFAQPDNTHLPQFYTKFQVPGVEGTDALCRPWPEGLLYAFLPLLIILLVIQKPSSIRIHSYYS
ncbi:PREDICTED: protein KASH5 [Thamnophis sirtalis]|uniref:Protein KASH5 n=1 Tax=Thamnophis sirtalis TaxID=35019 RepID=A0A6I9X346_9SAUR|nr:PREDICTED: protein KASH5 [Thamnophis sirtalis]